MTPAAVDELEPRAQVRELARLISPAVRIEPDRLRAVRLEFMPHSGPALEASLWFSPLVQARNVEGFVLQRHVTVALRETLVGAPNVAELRRIHEPFRRALPALLALEEEVVWQALAGAGPRAAEPLLAALKTMLSSPDRAVGLASWAVRALGELPTVVRRAPAAVCLDVATSARLRRPLRVDVLGTELLALPDLLPENIGDATVAVERRGDQLLLAHVDTSQPSALTITAPATDPVIISISSGGASQVAALAVGTPHTVQVRGDLVVLRTLRGDEWELAQRAATSQASVTRSFSWLHLSDLSIGEIDLFEVRRTFDALAEDLARMRDEVGELDALFVTGALTTDARDQLRDVAVDSLLELDLPVFAAPEPDEWDRQGGSGYWWKQFDEGLELLKGLVDGDVATTLHVHGLRVGIVCLAMTTSSSLDPNQLPALLHDPDAWCRSHDITVLVTHARRDQLDEPSRRHFDRFVAPPGRFDLQLSAEAANWTDAWRSGTTFQVRGQPLTAVEKPANAPKGYWLGRIDLDTTRRVTLWSRTWTTDRRSFEADRWIGGAGRHRALTLPLSPRPLARIPRLIATDILGRLARGSSLLLYGPPEVGKTTLLDDIELRLRGVERIDAADDNTLERIRRDRDAGRRVIWLIDDVDQVPAERRAALFETMAPMAGRMAESRICFTASSFETHANAPGIEPIAIADADEDELAILFAPRLAQFAAWRDLPRELYAWTLGHVGLAARILAAIDLRDDLIMEQIVARALKAPPLPPPRLGEVALELYEVLLAGEQLPRTRDRATIELLASGVAVETVGETGSDEVRLRNQIIGQIYDRDWADEQMPPRPPRWVFVAGSSDDDLHPDMRDVSRGLGEALAGRGIGLVTREHEGVYRVCATRYSEVCYELGLSARRRIICIVHGPGRVPSDAWPGFGCSLRPSQRPRLEAVEISDAVVVLSGSKRTREVFDHAIAMQKPVLAVGAFGGSASQHFETVLRSADDDNTIRFGLGYGSIRTSDYAWLNAVNAKPPEFIATIVRLLEQLFAL